MRRLISVFTVVGLLLFTCWAQEAPSEASPSDTKIHLVEATFKVSVTVSLPDGTTHRSGSETTLKPEEPTEMSFEELSDWIITTMSEMMSDALAEALDFFSEHVSAYPTEQGYSLLEAHPKWEPALWDGIWSARVRWAPSGSISDL